MADTTMTTPAVWHLDADDLQALAERRATTFRSAPPFPHLWVDDFLPEDVLRPLIDGFPGPDDDLWYRFDLPTEVKLALADETLMPEAHRHVLRELNGPAFVSFLERLSGIHGLIADPSLNGGGLHQIRPGGMLKVHADFNMHPATGLIRRLNVLLYLNEDWPASWGGDLELWDPRMTHAVQRIAPVANRLMIFETGPLSFHGHPDPLACPPDRTRRSLAWYYYVKPDPGTPFRGARFRERTGERFLDRRERLYSSLPFPAEDVARRVEAKVRHLARRRPG